VFLGLGLDPNQIEHNPEKCNPHSTKKTGQKSDFQPNPLEKKYSLISLKGTVLS
jgi:hypothetical protein